MTKWNGRGRDEGYLLCRQGGDTISDEDTGGPTLNKREKTKSQIATSSSQWMKMLG